MRWLLLTALLLWPMALGAADGDDLTATSQTMEGQGWSRVRYLICDSDTGVVTCSTLVTPGLLGATRLHWDYYRFYADESDVCTSWTATIRDYPINTAALCEGACDAHTITTIDKTATTSALLNTPLGEAFDADITAINTCTLSIYADFFYRSQRR
jgi:hypothetical protein